MTTAYQEERRVALTAVKAAASLCRRVQAENREALQKEDRSPVTVADFGSQAIVCKFLGDAFPDDPIVAEEASSSLRRPENQTMLQAVHRHVRHFCESATPEEACLWIDRGCAEAAPRFWLLDPIDGTKGFLRGDQYAVALALVVGGRLRLGVMGCPNLPVDPGTSSEQRGCLFMAVRGGGSSQVPLDGEQEKPLRVSSCRDPGQVLLAESFEPAHSDRDRQQKLAERIGIPYPGLRMDSQAKYGAVARGEVDLFMRLARPGYREKSWDHAAGAILVEEAGGRVTDFAGKPLGFERGRHLVYETGVLASSGVFHDRVLQAARQT